MATTFFSLDFPSVLQDLPHNFSHRISLFDGDGNFIDRQHMDRLDDFIDVEEVDYDDAKMRLFAQILSWEQNIWFKYLPTKSIATFEDFSLFFWIGGNIKTILYRSYRNTTI